MNQQVFAWPVRFRLGTREKMQHVLDTIVFPQSKYLKGGAEQDGFFLRCLEHHGWKTKFPPKPLATHLGYRGYNSPPGRNVPRGTLEERVQWVRELATNRQLRSDWFGQRITEEEMGGWDGRY